MIGTTPQRKGARAAQGGKTLRADRRGSDMDKAKGSSKPPVVKETAPARKPGPAKDSMVEQVGKYLKGVWAELKRVTWPTKDEVKRGTILVILTVLLISVYLAVVDKGFALVIGYLRSLLTR